MSDSKYGHIWLVGFSGSGKSTIGPKLARLIKRPFFDTDAMIERLERRTIAAVFSVEGKKYFRRRESEMIASLARRRQPAVIALGGGAFQSPANRRQIQTCGQSVYLRISASAVHQRLSAASDRPLLQVKPKRGETLKQARMRIITTLLSKRTRNYEKADMTVSVSSGTPHQIAKRIVAKVRSHHG